MKLSAVGNALLKFVKATAKTALVVLDYPAVFGRVLVDIDSGGWVYLNEFDAKHVNDRKRDEFVSGGRGHRFVELPVTEHFWKELKVVYSLEEDGLGIFINEIYPPTNAAIEYELERGSRVVSAEFDLKRLPWHLKALGLFNPAWAMAYFRGPELDVKVYRIIDDFRGHAENATA